MFNVAVLYTEDHDCIWPLGYLSVSWAKNCSQIWFIFTVTARGLLPAPWCMWPSDSDPVWKGRPINSVTSWFHFTALTSAGKAPVIPGWRLHGVQEKLRTPRCAQWDLLERRGIAGTSPGHLHWTPWGLLGRHATARTLCMHKVRAVARRSHGDLNERRVNAVGSQRQRSNSALRSPRALRGRSGDAYDRRKNAAIYYNNTGMQWRD